MAAQDYYNSFNQPNQQEAPPSYPPPQYQPWATSPQVQQPQFNPADYKPNHPQQLQTYNPQAPPYPHTPAQSHAQPSQPHHYYPPQNPQYLQPPEVRPPQKVRFDNEYDSDDEFSSEDEHLRRKRSVSEPPRHHHHRHRSHSRDRDRSRDRDLERSRQPTKRDHASRNTFLGAFGGSVIGDAIFPGLGTLGGALLGGIGGHETGRSRSERPSQRRKRDKYDDLWEEGRRRRGEID